MLHVALAGLLAGSLALSPADGDGPGDAKKTPNTDKPAAETVALPGVFDTASRAPESITVDTYAQGRPVAEAPIKIWAQYAYGQADERYDLQGDSAPLVGFGNNREVISQRIAVGAQLNFISFPRFRFGVGGQLQIAKNEFNANDGSVSPIGVPDLESDFGLQQVKVYGVLRGQTLGIHGGYAFDLGDDQEFGEPVAALGGARLPSNLAVSDGRDAIFFGADFDYPSERFRLFGGIDYYMLQGIDDDPNTAEFEDQFGDDDFLNFTAGAGVKFGFVELGAAAQIQTRFDQPTLRSVGTTPGIGSHIGNVVPYLRLSPPSLPASIYIKGSTLDEYFDYGYSIGGANTVKAGIGFTAGLSVGFQ